MQGRHALRHGGAEANHARVSQSQWRSRTPSASLR